MAQGTPRRDPFKVLLFFLGLLSSCSSLPKRENSFSSTDPDQTLKEICALGGEFTQAEGELWMKAKSAQTSGQFTGVFRATRGKKVVLDVVNPFGGTEAQLTLEGGRYTVRGGSNSKSAKGRVLQAGETQWGGIPLEWASALLSGSFPCPNMGQSYQVRWAEAGVGEQPKLEVSYRSSGLLASEEVFRYSVRIRSQKAWAEALQWERKGPFAQAVQFEFSNPHPEWSVPQKWTAVSSQGEVLVKWKKVELKKSAPSEQTTEDQK